MWLERADGFFFPRDKISAAIESTLQMLSLDGAAQISDEGFLLPFEQSFLLSEADAEELSLPPRNPYRISIRTEGYVGARNFRYVVEFLRGDDRPLVKPQINGALLRVDDKIFRLNADQFALTNLVAFGNQNLQPPLLTIRQMQRHAAQIDAKLDGYIADKKIVVPDKLSVDFTEIDGDKVKVNPVLLENRGGEICELDSTDFQGAFDNRRRISEVYRGRDGTQYVFDETLRDGLAQIKSVGTLSKSEAERCRLQPKELFTSAAFDFDYSDRVAGVEMMIGGTYQNLDGVKIDWADEEFHSEVPKAKDPVERPPTAVLKIKENFECVDYAAGNTRSFSGWRTRPCTT